MGKRIPTDDLLQEVERLAEELGSPPTGLDMDEHGAYSKETYRRRFDGWEHVLKESGVGVEEYNPTRKTSKEDLLEAIGKLADQLGHRPTSRDMEEHGEYSRIAYRNRFGNWNAALEEFGYDTQHLYPDSDLIRALREFALELEKTPTGPEMNEHGPFSTSVYRKRFGSWKRALDRADLRRHTRPTPNYQKGIRRYAIRHFFDTHYVEDNSGIPENPTPRMPDEVVRDAQVLADIVTISEEVGKSPTAVEVAKRRPYSVEQLRSQFGTWTNALSKVGLEPRNGNEVHEHDLINDIQETAESLGETPTCWDVAEHANRGVGTYRRHFGSWGKALEAAGFEPNRRDLITVTCDNCSESFKRSEKHVFNRVFCDAECVSEWQTENYTGEANPRWSGGYDGYYGPDWEERRREALERDSEKCAGCGMTNDEHRREHGRGLHVHHREPFRSFDDHEEANQLSNLVTLCEPCHKKWERLPVQIEVAQ